MGKDASEPEAMASKEVLLKVLLDELVDPHLPVRIPSGTPPIDKQRSVAKQVSLTCQRLIFVFIIGCVIYQVASLF